MSASTLTTVWVSPSATCFTCLCEPCLEAARRDGLLFSDALAAARVSGELAPEALHHAVRCRQGHDIVLRRTERPPRLDHAHERQLQLA